jgi:hypothetical protein
MEAKAVLNESPAQRLRVALDLFEFGTDMMRQKLRRDAPEATEEEIQTRFIAWLQERPGAEHGDSVGRPAPWPRIRR